jgi:hypothetical protein
MTTQRKVGLALGVAGIAGLSIGVVTGLLAASSWSRSQSECESAGSCSNHAAAVTDHDAAVTRGNVSTAAFVAGGVLFAGGAAVFLTGGHPSGRRRPTRSA